MQNVLFSVFALGEIQTYQTFKNVTVRHLTLIDDSKCRCISGGLEVL
jgi:hypothetical protein